MYLIRQGQNRQGYEMQVRTRKAPKSDPEVEAPALDQLEEKFLRCRDLRHSWKEVGYWRDSSGENRRLVCSGCRTIGYDTWVPGLGKKPRRYEYPDGYRIEGGRIASEDVHEEIMRRVTVYNSQEEMMAALAGGKRVATKRSTTASRARHPKVVDITDRADARKLARTRAVASR